PWRLGAVELWVLSEEIRRSRREAGRRAHRRRERPVVVERARGGLPPAEPADEARPVVHPEVATEVEKWIGGHGDAECEIARSDVFQPELARFERSRCVRGRMRERHTRA